MPYDPIERVGVHRVGELIASELGWIFREQTTDDWGIDAQVEVVEKEPTGRLIALQIKTGLSYFDEQTDEHYVYRGDRRHLNYWRGHSLPVIIVVYHPEFRVAFWEIVSSDKAEETGTGWKIRIPKSQTLNASSLDPWRRIALPKHLRRMDYLAALINGFSCSEYAASSRLPVILASLFSAQHEIQICSPYVDRDFATAIAVASDSVTTSLITRSSDSVETVGPLEGRNVRVLYAPVLHEKLILLDGCMAILASANLAGAGMQNSFEVFVATTDPAVVNGMRAKFVDVWDQLGGLRYASTH